MAYRVVGSVPGLRGLEEDKAPEGCQALLSTMDIRYIHCNAYQVSVLPPSLALAVLTETALDDNPFAVSHPV